jgi:polar amino acid transport system substrate-binding protein
MWIALVFALPAAACAMELVTEDYPPFNIPAENDRPISGISTEIIREMMRRADIPISISMFPWQRALSMAATQPDTCAYSAVRTAKRELFYKWVGPIVSDDWALFATADSGITLKSLDDARKYRIGGYMGDAAGDFLVSQHFNVELAQSDKLNPRKLEHGRIDLWIAGVRTGPYVASREGVKGIRPVLTFGEARDYQMYLACSPAVPDATIRRLNEILRQMQSEGVIAKVYANYSK